MTIAGDRRVLKRPSSPYPWYLWTRPRLERGFLWCDAAKQKAGTGPSALCQGPCEEGQAAAPAEAGMERLSVDRQTQVLGPDASLSSAVTTAGALPCEDNEAQEDLAAPLTL